MFVALCAVVSPVIGIELTAHGWLNAVGIGFFIFTYILDGQLPRRDIYRMLGREEPFLSLEWRFWRMITTMTLVLIGLTAALLARTENGTDKALSPDITGIMAVGVGVWFATAGWMYTVFQTQKADRIRNALTAIRHALYDEPMSAYHRELEQIVVRVRDQWPVAYTEPLPKVAGHLRASSLARRSTFRQYQDAALEEMIDEILDQFDQLSFGVRSGQLDHTTVAMTLRKLMLRYALTFANFIADYTNAAENPADGRLTAMNREHEHFLWLVSRLEIRKDDGVNPALLIAPPVTRVWGSGKVG